ncbi:MAG TPA: tail fiber domain-containing protein [Stellaceae bacterium]|nr:tail fiber domain-containing protein [Stellaceae bacterium]
MTSDRNTPKIPLDWSRLLGFDLADPADEKSAPAKLADARLAKLGAKIGGKPVKSDLRLKTDITRIGTAAHGLPLYSFRYIGETDLYEGVMAQDVLRVMPSAVGVAEDGYYRVDYEQLGIPFRRPH